MEVRKQAVALLLAVLLAFTSASPAAASAAHMQQARSRKICRRKVLILDPVKIQTKIPKRSGHPGSQRSQRGSSGMTRGSQMRSPDRPGTMKGSWKEL